MAGMLPGVELARRRRTHHHHHYHFENTREPCLLLRPRMEIARGTSMDETALIARRRLEEKLLRLRGIGYSRNTNQPSQNRGSNEEVGANNNIGMGAVRREKSITPQLSRRNSAKEVCAVCLDEMQARQQVMNLPCSHRYHRDCLLPWLKDHSHCPCCRSHVPS